MSTMNDMYTAWDNAMDKLSEAHTTDTAATLADISLLDDLLDEHGLTMRDLFGYWFTDRGGNLRMRANHVAKNAPDPAIMNLAASGFAMLKWHRSSGSIDSLMIARLRLGATRYAQMETLTVTLQLVMYGPSPAVEAWNRALGRS